MKSDTEYPRIPSEGPMESPPQRNVADAAGGGQQHSAVKNGTEHPEISGSRPVKLLVANRGEIAVRIIRACREMGIGAVAVYSEADRLAPHVLLADQAVPIGPAPAAESYLRVDRILEAARATGATMVHPGYGFLAENAEFAEAVEAAGLTWVGPPPRAIRLMGSKTEARKVAAAAGAPVIPGLMEPVSDPAELVAFASEHGFPLLLKAVAGGGGKGMRRVEREEELLPSFERARSEGRAYFGDDRVFVEKLLTRPRHIEVQVAADVHGNVVHLGERECSIQRRHQKVVEESPSPVVDAGLRERLGEAALAVTRAAGYHSVGTVEMLMDEDGSFYFLEMNTRLQVEHPVTEMVYGVDLVREQIRIAMGLPLPWRQEDLLPRGHAVECRVYAEDPSRNFAPSPGTIQHLTEPSGPGVRVDSGVLQGGVVPLDYDPMLAKLVVWAESREAALERLRRALGEYRIDGIATTLPLFKALVDDPEFRAGRIHTGFLDGLLAEGSVLGAVLDPGAEDAACIAAACLATLEAGRLPDDPWAHAGERGWWEEGLRVLHGRFPR